MFSSENVNVLLFINVKAGLRHFLPSGWWLGTWWCRALSGKNLCFVRCLARLDTLLSNVPVSQKRCEPVWRGAHNYYRLANERTLHKNRCIMWVFHKCSNARRDNRVEIWKMNVVLCVSVIFWVIQRTLISSTKAHSLCSQQSISINVKNPRWA